MRAIKTSTALLAAALMSLAAAVAQAQSSGVQATENQPAPMVMLVPVQISSPAMKSGCWVQFYDERNFKGEIFTVAGPIEIESATKSAGRHLKSNVDSLVTGPKAILTVYEHQMFKDKAVKFDANSKEPALVKKLGATGRIQSLKLDCAS